MKTTRIEGYTPSTITDRQALFDRVRADREQGFAIVDEELERGLRALAVPVLDRNGDADRRHQSLDPHRPHHAQRNARSFLAGAENDCRANASVGGVTRGAPA